MTRGEMNKQKWSKKCLRHLAQNVKTKTELNFNSVEIFVVRHTSSLSLSKYFLHPQPAAPQTSAVALFNLLNIRKAQRRPNINGH